ncbi:DUF4369 domain-containing protein [Flavobacterium crassostreae]|uniref:Type IV secretion system putative lipoprotein virB7 n=1 Tax=Flavobacterium crassostreae TaxID=1763534 RepID=A0A1B9E9E9_9FLAO|nr:DUF4369 domain-containing protein [Flavobacterium crassostreae]OCB78590.1 thiol:disulfide interchange protein [Flavobacterium crassostreae]
MKKIILFLSAAVVMTSCSKDKYTISGTAKGIENGKTIIVETQDANGMGLIAVDTVVVENEKFEINGKAAEPVFHTLQLEGVQGKVPFILENGDITIVIDKDSIQKSKVSGTYNNDEYVTFNEEIKVVQKKLMDFQKNNMQTMNTAQQNKDTAVINSLMQQFSKLQEETAVASKAKYIKYAETHPKSLISALIIQGMINDPSADIKKSETIYNSFDESLKNTKPGKAIKAKLDETKTPTTGATAPVEGDAK